MIFEVIDIIWGWWCKVKIVFSKEVTLYLVNVLNLNIFLKVLYILTLLFA